MRLILSLFLVAVLAVEAAPDAASVQAQIAGMPLGANIELRLKNNEKLRGTRGSVSESGFTLVDARSRERTIAFNDVSSVKQVSAKSHTTRNILIGVGIGVAVAAVVLINLALSCNSFYGC
jgi:hypothetical protein